MRSKIELQHENVEAQVGAAEKRVTSLEREVRQIQEQIQKLTVVATRDGFVVHVPSWNGEKVKAAKLYRERTGASLREAKQAVESVAARHGLTVEEGGGCGSSCSCSAKDRCERRA